MLSGASNETPNLNCFKTKEIYTWQCRKWRLRQPAGGSRSHGVYQEPGCACLRHPPPFCVGIVPKGVARWLQQFRYQTWIQYL